MMRIYTYFSLPSLYVHELLHIVLGFLSGYIFDLNESFTIWHDDGGYCIGLEPKNKRMNLFQLIMVPMAPLYFIIFIAILSFSNPVFIGILIYIIITYRYSFPSEGDFNQLRYAKVFLKYKFSDKVFIRFMEAKSKGIVFLSNNIIETPCFNIGTPEK